MTDRRPPSAPTDPIVGAIRWDAWYGEGGPVAEVERSLGPKKFHFRMPFFAKVLSDSTVQINGDTQAVMDQEIAYAEAMGLDYWAFVDYWTESPLINGLRRYLAAKDRRGIRYCFIEEGGRLDKYVTDGWARVVGHFKNPDYQLVLDGRPLLFVLGAPTRIARQDFDALAAASIAAGLKKPYVVFMGFNPVADLKIIETFGFDAVSAYAAVGGGHTGGMKTYQQLTEQVERDDWNLHAAHGVPAVTFATTGWDLRTRIEHPMSWEGNYGNPQPDPTPPSQQQPLIDDVTAKPAQIAEHLRRALEWTREHRDLNPANAVIIYAWNENDEGGWLIPTLKQDGSADTGRLEAVRSVLRGAAQQKKA